MKRFLSILLALCLLLSLGVSVSAAGTGTPCAVTGGSSAEPSVRNEKVTITYRGIRILLDGKQIAPVDEQGKSTEPFILGGSTYLPVRSIAGALGLEVGWDAAASSIVLTSGSKASEGGSPAASHLSKEVTVTYRGTKLILDGKQIALVNANGDSVEPFIYEGSNYLPLRVVGEALGLKVGWDAATSTVSLLSEGTELSRVTETLAMDKAGEMLLSTRETITVSRPDSIRTTVYEGGGSKTESIQYLDSEGQLLSAEHYDAEGELCATELWEWEGDYLHYTRDDLRDDNADCYIRYYYRDGRLHSAREYGGSTLSKVHSTDHDYDYDEAGRLIRHYIHSPDASWEEILYSYDGDGNLLRMQGEAYDIHSNGFGRYYTEYFYEDGVLVKSESTGGCVTEYFYGSGGELVKTVSENPDGSYLIRQYK